MCLTKPLFVSNYGNSIMDDTHQIQRFAIQHFPVSLPNGNKPCSL